MWLALLMLVAHAADADADGFDDRTDCDDTDPSVHPGATERCNAADDDCDGRVDESGCDCPVRVEGEAAYQLCEEVRTWTGASDACASSGYHLLVVDDAAESAWIQDGAAAAELSTWWIGLSDRATEGSFLWEDGSAPAWTDWGAGQPDDGVTGGEDCVMTSLTLLGTWWDASCSTTAGRVCEATCANDWHRDADGDGYGDAEDVESSCEAPSGRVWNALDCDDDDPAIHPGATERDNGIDDDCDGRAESGDDTGDTDAPPDTGAPPDTDTPGETDDSDTSAGGQTDEGGLSTIDGRWSGGRGGCHVVGANPAWLALLALPLVRRRRRTC